MTHEEERNYCPRCGKRLGKSDWDVHTCTPPQENPAPCARHCEANAFQIVIKNLKAQLAQPEQKPVAWMGTDIEGNPNKFRLNFFSGAIPLFTTPPQRKPLTDEEIINKCLESGFERNCLGWSFTYGKLDYHLLKLARAIEAAHNIKEKKHDATTK